MQFSSDLLINAIYQGIKRDIQVAYENECYRAVLILIYCGVDAMAYLDMPPNQAKLDKQNFIQWAERYLSPKLSNQTTHITGDELYSARCAVVHTYGTESIKTKSGEVRRIGHIAGGNLPIAWAPEVNTDTVLLRLESLRDAFFTAIDEFLVESYADKQKQPILNIRLETLLNIIPSGNRVNP